MSSVSVGDVLEDQWAVACDSVLLPVFNGCFDGEDVHAVDFESWDVLTAFVVLCKSGGTVGGGTHSVLVVWTTVSNL